MNASGISKSLELDGLATTPLSGVIGDGSPCFWCPDSCSISDSSSDLVSFIASLLGAGVRLWLELLAAIFAELALAPEREDTLDDLAFAGDDASD